jgi:histidinol dehydrogenase
MIRVLDARMGGLDAVLAAVQRSPADVAADVHATVDAIVADVRARGDAALVELTARLDGFAAPDAAALAITRDELEAAARAIDPDVRAALAYAARRIERYHAAARSASWRITDEDGSVLGQEIRPLDRVGVYVPGGRAAYPSTVLMTAIPARVAGVREIVLVSPPGRDGGVPAAVLAAAHVAGVTEGYRLGGAQAVAALAYGTASIRRVDKIVGPGNVYVALAKLRVFGDVGIDMMAGPSEVLVIADAAAHPDLVAADLLAQAEHDPMARALLVTDAPDLVRAVQAALGRQLPALPRRAIAEASLRDHGALVLTADLDAAVELANRLAPEHLELFVRAPAALLPRVRHAGAIFMGGHTPEVVGDYVAGPSHVLPTAGTARFASPLGVEDFVTRASVIEYSPEGLAAARPHIRALARVEGLHAHGVAAELRTGTTLPMSPTARRESAPASYQKEPT